MLSPGKYHEQVPKELEANLRFRKAILLNCENSRRFQEATLHACQKDILFYINTFVWQYNPRKKGISSIGPFITYPFQEKAFISQDPRKPGILWCYENDEDMVVEKSRELGLSWMFLIADDWLSRFLPNLKSLVVSRSADAVDEPGNPDSLFWKIKFINDHLPAWLRRGFEHKKYQISYKDTKGVITGEASTGKAGVGGRASVIFVDEFSQIREAREILHRTSDTSSCRFFNGTHLGTATAFYELTKNAYIKKLTMHWSEHPEKNKGLYHFDAETSKITVLDKGFKYPLDFQFITDGTPTGGPFPGIRSPWYDKECLRKGSSRAISMDLDIDPQGAVSQFFNAIKIRSLMTACVQPLWEGDVDSDPVTGQPREPFKLVYRAGGSIQLWVNPRSDGSMPFGRYAGGSDLSWGTGATNTCLTIVDAITGMKVLEYANPNIGPTPYAYVVHGLCNLFRSETGESTKFAWEMNGPGQVFAKTFLDTLGYRNIYYRTNEMPHTMSPEISDKPGWNADPQAIDQVLSEYAGALYSHRFINNSKRALEETLDFKYDDTGHVDNPNKKGGDDPSGARVGHADRVIADALAWKMALLIGEGVSAKAKKEPISENSLAGRRLRRQNDARSTVWL